jgi:multidrug efflux system outer membrane protein
MRKNASCVALAAFVAGCASTPPPPPEPDLPATTAGDLQLDHWWTAFGDPTLDALVAEALGNNLNLKAAITRVQYGRALVLIAQGDQIPTVDLAVGASRYRSTQVGSNPLPPGFSPYTTDLTVGLQASQVDLRGSTATRPPPRTDDLLATEYARRCPYAGRRRHRARLLQPAPPTRSRSSSDTLQSRDETALQKDRFQAGVIGEYDLRTAEAERAAVAGDVAIARRARSEFESALAVLLGRSPKEVFAPRIDRNVEMVRLLAVPTLPSGVPSDMLARRPMSAAEAQFAAANLRTMSRVPIITRRSRSPATTARSWPRSRTCSPTRVVWASAAQSCSR